jgi:hypothetical protein
VEASWGGKACKYGTFKFFWGRPKPIVPNSLTDVLSGHGVKTSNAFVLPNVGRLKQRTIGNGGNLAMYYAAIGSPVGVVIDVSVANSANNPP